MFYCGFATIIYIVEFNKGGKKTLAKLFDKIPDELFSPLSRKYKTVYSYALICLYHLLKSRKSDIKRSEYVSLLKSSGDEFFGPFDVETDRLDDKDEKESVSFEGKSDDVDSLLQEKVSYVIRKLSKCGWFIISKDPKTNVEYIYIPAYSIQFMRLLDDLTSDASSYLPLVHQTYAELKMEDEKEDDYMYRSLMNARNNADNLEMNVTLLRQQICVFGNRLTGVLDPNEALKQHFDEYRVDISEKYYHPMKTFDSLGLYAQPTIQILKKWLKSERIVTLLVKEAKAEPQNSGRDQHELVTSIIKTIQDIIDIFSRLSSAFDDIDRANANYTEAVQRKVNYLSSSDKTVQGKIKKIILSLANEIKNNPALKYEELPLLSKASDTLNLTRQGFVDSRSMTMPFKRGFVDENVEPMPLDDAFDFESDSAVGFQAFLDRELDKFSDEAVMGYIESNMKDKDSIQTEEFSIKDSDELVLYIFGILKSLMGLVPYSVTKLQDRIEYAGYYMPSYQFRRTKKRRNV